MFTALLMGPLRPLSRGHPLAHPKIPCAQLCQLKSMGPLRAFDYTGFILIGTILSPVEWLQVHKDHHKQTRVIDSDELLQLHQVRYKQI
jgi:hypothetical protein